MSTVQGSVRSPKVRYRRILMALDAAYENLAAVEEAAALAARLQAELIGLFVEDVDLARLADHPGVSMLSTLTATRQASAADQLKRALRSQLVRSEQALKQAASRRQVKSTFQVRQGRLAAEVQMQAEDTDLVIVSWSGERSGMSLTTRSVLSVATACAVAEAAGRSVLLLRPGAAGSASRLLVAYDGSEAAKEALAVAIELADRRDGSIEVVLLVNRLALAETWREKLSAEFAEADCRAQFVHLPNATADDLCRIAERERISLMVLPAEMGLIKSASLSRLVERARCSLLLVH